MTGSWAEWLAANTTPAAVRERLLDLVDVGAGDVVVDLGAGTGFVSDGARARGADAVAVEPDASCLAELRARGFRARAGRAESIPLEAGSADGVLVRSVLIYVEDLDACAREIARVLRPGGRFAAFEPLNRRSTYLHDVVDWSPSPFDVAADDREWILRTDPLSRLDEDALEQALLRAGLGDVVLEQVAEDEPWLVTEASVEARLDAVGAPGRPSRRERWLGRYGEAETARLVSHLKSLAGETLPLRWVSLYAAARKP